MAGISVAAGKCQLMMHSDLLMYDSELVVGECPLITGIFMVHSLVIYHRLIQI